MSTPTPLERAKAGEAEAIAALINRPLHSKGIQVRAVREAYHLTLWVTSSPSPPPETVARYIRQGIEKLNIPSIGILTIIGQVSGQSTPSWHKEISLLAAYAQGQAPLPRDAIPGEGLDPDGNAEPLAQGAAPISDSIEEQAEVEAAYHTLQVPTGAPLSEVDAAYFKLKSLMLKQGKREVIASLKAAHGTLKEHLQRQTQPPIVAQNMNDSAEEPTLSELLTVLFRQQGLPARVRLQQGHVEIQLPANPGERPHRVVAQVYTLLTQSGRAIVGTTKLEKVTVYGLNNHPKDNHPKVVWKQSFSGSQLRATADDTDLLSFNNRYSNLFIFPALMALAMVMNAMPVSSLLFGVKIWFHEFGHATVAWLGGRKAIPLPIGWTSVDLERSLLVYLGVFALLGLLYWSGRREQQRWPMILAVILGILQFGMTWLMPPDTFEMLLSFGGIGGEFYLCTLLMVSFYFPLPAYWRWDFYRYPVVLGAAFTFWGQLWLWKQIEWGQAAIPWGSLWGGAEHGDMNTLALYGWSDQRIVGTYNTLGNVCLVALLSVYIYFALRHYRPALFIRQQP
ncbi:MAG: hypothetical protein O2890_10375 [Cyanobacteria bacterium]|nr:hypothetical protein [Cyanobacteriota bacterium]MDA0866806.1 hypothetical protein [Cyanobacteriota bacterium]